MRRRSSQAAQMQRLCGGIILIPRKKLKKQKENLTKLQERFSKLMNMKTEILNISSPKQSGDSLVLQSNEFHFDPEAEQTFVNWFEKCEDIFETIHCAKLNQKSEQRTSLRRPNQRDPKRTPQSKDKKKSYENGKETLIRKLNAILENFWMTAHLRLNGKSPMKIVMGRSKSNKPLKGEYVVKKEYETDRRTSNEPEEDVLSGKRR
ncbi:hypothetical protein ACTXT7_010629 [Hymenolepis weldensis]